MSVIFGVLSEKEGAFLAADSMAFHHTGVKSGHCHKIVPLPSNRVAIAVSGYLRTLNVIEVHKLSIDRAFCDGGIEGLVCEVRRLMQADGWRPDSTDGPWDHGSCMIVATPDRVYEVGAVFSYIEKEIGQPAAYGSGMEVAIGAWTACQELTEKYSALLEMTMIDRMRLVISTAIEHVSTTGGRIYVWKAGNEMACSLPIPMSYRRSLHAGD